MLKIDREEYFKSIKRWTSYYKNINGLTIKIFGQNIRTIDELNRALIINSLDEIKPDFFLLNECNIGLAKFKVQGYNIELSKNQEVGIITKNIFYLNV